MYQFTSRVRYSEIGLDHNLTFPSLIDYFQDCSTFQSEDRGVGITYLEKHHRAWILSSWQIVVNRYPQLGERITVSTWAYGLKGFYGNRNFQMEDEQGEVLAFANSVWVYMDTQSGHPVRIDETMQRAYEINPQIEYPWEGRKIKVPQDRKPLEPFPVRTYHLDTNHHVNNGQYVCMAQEFLPKEFKIHQIRAEYLKSAVLGDEIIPEIGKEQDWTIVTLSRPDGAIYAIISFE